MAKVATGWGILGPCPTSTRNASAVLPRSFRAASAENRNESDDFQTIYASIPKGPQDADFIAQSLDFIAQSLDFTAQSLDSIAQSLDSIAQNLGALTGLGRHFAMQMSSICSHERWR